MITEKNKMYEDMIASSQILSNDDLLEASSALANVVNKIKTSQDTDLKEALGDQAQAVLDDFDELAREAQKYTPEYERQDQPTANDTIEDIIYESKDEEDTDLDNKIQKTIYKLVSEEMISHDLYIACTMAAKKDVSCEFRKMFISIAADELDDHAKELSQWAIDNGYDVPFKYKDYKKNSDKDLVKQLDGLKAGQDAKYYVEEAIKQENIALKSYEKAMEYDGTPYELHSILLKIYYDEQEHLNDLQTLHTAVEANAHLTWY